MYLAMARVAHREGYPEIGLYWEKAAYEEAEHAAKFAELLGEVVTDSTKKNLEMRVEAENGATAGKTDLAKRAKALNLDAIHDTFTRWPATRPVTARLSPACSRDTSANKKLPNGKSTEPSRGIGKPVPPLFYWRENEIRARGWVAGRQTESASRTG